MQAQIKKLKAACQKDRLELLPQGTWPLAWHRFDKPEQYATQAALLSGRPLLIRGEPGIGKSQLARAAAAALDRHFLSTVVQPDSEHGDLLWAMDHTKRLADAQIQKDVSNAEAYIGPGALWWALNWDTAYKQHKDGSANFVPPHLDELSIKEDESTPQPENISNGAVLLIDEIDKADISFANALLEVLGNRSFYVSALGKTVKPSGPLPFVVLTSNDTRELPAALIRRCVVLNIRLPEEDAAIRRHLIEIGKTHYPHMHEDILTEAAKQIVDDRNDCAEPPLTGQAEYLDLLSALYAAEPADKDAQLTLLKQLAEFFYKSQAVER